MSMSEPEARGPEDHEHEGHGYLESFRIFQIAGSAVLQSRSWNVATTPMSGSSDYSMNFTRETQTVT